MQTKLSYVVDLCYNYFIGWTKDDFYSYSYIESACICQTNILSKYFYEQSKSQRDESVDCSFAVVKL